MAQWFRKVKAGLVKDEITEFVGEEGNIFFNIATGELRLSDGATPGGLIIGSGGGGGGPSFITVQENSVTKGSVTRLNFANSLVTVSGTTANIIAPSGGGGGGSGGLNEISLIDSSNNLSNRIFLPDAILFDNTSFGLADLGNGDVKVSLGTINAPKFNKYIISGLSIVVPKAEHGISFPSTVVVLNGEEEVSVEVHIGQTVGVDEGDVSVFSNIPLDGHRIIIS